VRANSIFRKLDVAALSEAHDFVAAAAAAERGGGAADLSGILAGEAGDELWSLVTLAARLDELIAQSAEQAEPSYLAKYAFQLARAFNLFYHRHRIIAEENQARRAVLVTIADYVRRQLTRALATLGIDVPERM
jgi:arginyl-tRNA synthetase